MWVSGMSQEKQRINELTVFGLVSCPLHFCDTSLQFVFVDVVVEDNL